MTPAMPHDRPKMRGTLMPTLRASSWSAEVARMARPVRVYWKKTMNSSAATMATTNVASNACLRMMASLNAPGNGMVMTSLGEKGEGKLFLGSMPKTMAVAPSRNWARPRVIRMMASSGWPVIGRSASRSMTSPSPAMTAMASGMAAQRGRLKISLPSSLAPANHHVRNAPSMTSCPWEKLNTSDER